MLHFACVVNCGATTYAVEQAPMDVDLEAGPHPSMGMLRLPCLQWKLARKSLPNLFGMQDCGAKDIICSEGVFVHNFKHHVALAVPLNDLLMVPLGAICVVLHNSPDRFSV